MAGRSDFEQSFMIDQPTATLLGALIGFIGGLIVARIQYAQKSDELFFKALDYLKGGTQPRNLGIAALELYWENRRHRPLCVSLLVGTAIYLLLESLERNKAHELNNLRRIMRLLLSSPRVLTKNKEQRNSLANAIKVSLAGHPTGVIVPREELVQWLEQVLQ